MGDPLSVAAAVAGLLTTAATTSKLIIGIVQRVKAVPVECERVVRELDDIRNILSQLQLFILGTTRPSRSRTSLIMADQVVTVLASCVTTFSDVEEFASLLDRDEIKGLMDRARWIAKENELKEILSRLQMNKTSMSLMLSILLCQIQSEAEAKVDRLCELVEQSLERNEFLAQRLVIYEPVAMSAPEMRDLSADGLNLRRAKPIEMTASESALAQRNVRAFAFEELLHNSRVYCRARSRGEDATSVLSAGTRACNWSMLSGLSLSEVSNISIVAIPIYAEDVHNAANYEFETFPRPVEESMLSELQISAYEGQDHVEPLQSRENEIRPMSLGDTHLRPTAPDLPTNNSDLTAQPPKIFGMTLAKAVVYASSPVTLLNTAGKESVYGFIPSIIAIVAAHVKREGLRNPELFIVNGHATRVAELGRSLERHISQGKGDGFDWAKYTVLDAANVLIRYLKTLPEPIVPFEHYDRFTILLIPFIEEDGTIRLPKQSSLPSSGLITELRAALVKISANNRLLLLYLLDLLHVLSSFAEDYHVLVTRLISVFQPSLLSRRPHEMEGIEHYLAAQTMIFMVENHGEFLDGMMKLNLPGELDYPKIEKNP